MNQCSQCKEDCREFFVFKKKTYCENCVDPKEAKALKKRISDAKRVDKTNKT
ncbi:MAG: hypothetical protein KAS32_05890 [Candidatus Peribacteraceae bacterium]|nr:hypothetical protein [Candidatus Peribacteraceae bacterium]